ncbi:MAG: elongation factor 1-beta [Candidatus Bathyarchaeota archaeon]|nr:elongation factor 1-beta [Candidatus Bathyarchaeota archaeon]
MANIVVSFRIMPEGIDVDFEQLKKQIETVLPPKAAIYADFQIEPIAFGLNALIAHIKFPEDETGILDEAEQSIDKVPGVSRIQTLMVRRTR